MPEVPKVRIERAIDESLGRPIHKEVKVVGPNSAGEYHINFSGTNRKLSLVYLCPWDRAPMLAIWEHEGKPVPGQNINGWFGINSLVRLNRKDYSGSLIKSFQTANLQGVIFYDHVPGMSEAGVAQMANAEAQLINDARSAKDNAMENKIAEAMRAGRHSHQYYLPNLFFEPAEEKIQEQVMQERFKPMAERAVQHRDDFVLIRAADPRTVGDEVFLRLMFGMMQVADEALRTDQQGRRTTNVGWENMAKLADGVEARIAHAQHFSRLYLRSFTADALSQLTKPEGVLGGVLTPLPELTGRGKPFYLLNYQQAVRKLRTAADALERPGMPRTVPKGFGYSEPEFENVLLYIEALINIFAGLGDLTLPPQFSGYIRERTGQFFELVQERVIRGTEGAGKELMRKWDRERLQDANAVGMEWPLADDGRAFLETISAGRLDEAAFLALPEDLKELMLKWIAQGVAVDAKTGGKAWKPYDVKLSDNFASIVGRLLNPPAKPTVQTPGNPEFVLSVDRLKDVTKLIAQATEAATVVEAKPAGPLDEPGYLILAGATFAYRGAIGELRDAQWHPKESVWTVRYANKQAIPSGSPVYHAIMRGEISTYELTESSYKGRYGARES